MGHPLRWRQKRHKIKKGGALHPAGTALPEHDLNRFKTACKRCRELSLSTHRIYAILANIAGLPEN
ncbi:hypothetical protein LF95_22000 [Thalassospira sp. TSL5-1]|nr:hypothetical protein LF95_22000 [Thalassospira sp. TSL5-1]